nr:MAG TPA: hypothetical protein [Caudoviricetes sp.]
MLKAFINSHFVKYYESVGWGFEPLMAHHKTKALKILCFTVIQGFLFAWN